MQVNNHVLSDIEDHLTLLRSKFDCIFSTEKVAPPWVQKSFLANINDVEKNFQEIFGLKTSGTASMMFTTSNLTEVWLPQIEVYKYISRIAFNHLLPFATIYLCEQRFSTFIHIKSKDRTG